MLGPTRAKCKELVSGLWKDANLEQGLTWGKHCPGATPASENSSESLWEGPEPALPVLCSPCLTSRFLCRPPRVFALPESWHLESPELESLFGTVLSHSLVPAVFQGALPKSLSHARSCQALLLGSQANPGTARALLLPQTSPWSSRRNPALSRHGSGIQTTWAQAADLFPRPGVCAWQSYEGTGSQRGHMPRLSAHPSQISLFMLCDERVFCRDSTMLMGPCCLKVGWLGFRMGLC